MEKRRTIDIDRCIQELTAEEKLSLLEGADMGFTNSIERLGIPGILMADGPHGVRVVKGFGEACDKFYDMAGEMEAATALPCEAAMASSWNLSLLTGAGSCVGEECQEYGVGVLLGPGADGKRSPLGGRNFEYYSEDPYLSGRMAAAFITGLQNEGVGACLKHYVLNDQETRRMSVDVHVDERPLWEIYLKPFEIAIKEAKPWSIMASYNKASGVYLTENSRLLQEILRTRLGFDGAVISDWSAVKDKKASIKNGLDLQMPGPSGQLKELLEALEKGELTEEEINERVRNVLRLVNKVLMGRKRVSVDWNAHHDTAVRLIEEGMVLLKNEEELLPLKQGCRLAVIGELAEHPLFSGGGSSSLTPRQLDYPLECMKQQAQICYAPGYHDDKTNEDMLKGVREAAENADAVLVFLGLESTEGLDHKDILLPGAQLQALREAAGANSKIAVVMQSGSAVDCREVQKNAKAILQAWIPGEGFGKALSNLLFGLSSPSGKLSETFPVILENTPAYQYFPGFKDDVYYHEGLLTGYRYYDTKKIRPQYAFGYGLSYTSFAYSNLKLSADRLTNKEKLKVSLDITNTGKVSGKEVVQIYVKDSQSHMFRPDKELKGFAKISLAPGETRTVEIVLEEDAFAYYVPHLERFAVETGEFEILAGASSGDIRLKEKVLFISEDDVRIPLTGNDLFKDFMADERYAEYAKQLLDALNVDEKNMFYKLLYGSCVSQLSGLMRFLGVGDEQTGAEMVENLLARRRIMEQ